MKNIKVMNTKPEVTDEEINSFMDFDKLILRHRDANKRNTNQKFRIAIITLSIVMIASLLSWFSLRDEKESAKPVEKIPSEQTKKSPDKAIANTDSIEKTESIAPKKLEQKQSLKKSDRADAHENTLEKPSNEKPNVETNLPAVFIQAEPIAGYPNLYEYFSRELTYPPSRMKDSVSGVVTVVFTISKNGSPEKIEIEQTLGKEFDDEAIRVIKNMPPWNPATYNGKPMPSRISLPLTFQIKKLK